LGGPIGTHSVFGAVLGVGEAARAVVGAAVGAAARALVGSGLGVIWTTFDAAVGGIATVGNTTALVGAASDPQPASTVVAAAPTQDSKSRRRDNRLRVTWRYPYSLDVLASKARAGKLSFRAAARNPYLADRGTDSSAASAYVRVRTCSTLATGCGLGITVNSWLARL
jgi:hypothetical protein